MHLCRAIILERGDVISPASLPRTTPVLTPEGGGTITLWSKNYGPGAAAEQVSNMSVPLSNLSVPGRLTIQVTAAASRQNSAVSPSTLTFRIDFIGVQ